MFLRKIIKARALLYINSISDFWEKIQLLMEVDMNLAYEN